MSAEPSSTATSAQNSPPPDPTRPAAPPLPTEVLSTVFQFAIPPSLSPRAFAKRAKLLCRFSLVAKAWHSPAQAHLFQLVWLPLPRTAWKLVGSGAGKGFGQRTRSFKLGKEWKRAESEINWHKSPATISNLLRLMPFITEMWLEEVNVDPAVLAWAQDLKTLHLNEVELQLHKDPYYWHLPKLETLFATAVTFTSADGEIVPARPLFTPLTLPALTTVAWTWDEDNSEPDFQLLSHQLTHLFLHRTGVTTSNNPAPRYPTLSVTLLTSLTSLQHLLLTVRYLADIPLLNTIPSHLRSLHLWSLPSAGRYVEPHLVATGPKPRSLDQAEVLFLPFVRQEEMERDEEGREVEPEWRVKTRQWAESTRIYEVEMKMDKEDAMDMDAKRWLHHVSQVAPSPSTTGAASMTASGVSSTMETKTATAAGVEEEQQQTPEGGFAEQRQDSDQAEKPQNREDSISQVE